jgi:beta-glucanase (GH16 family)
VLAVAAGVAPTAHAQNNIAPPQPGYVLTFNDEFEDTRLDTSKWSTYFEKWNVRGLWDNGERQMYVDPAMADKNGQPVNINPHRVGNGKLTILAYKVPEWRKPALWGLDYTSGMISTEKSHAQQYGYFEMRAKFPKGKGLWQALWLLPIDGSWPPEYDIVEVLGDEPDVVYQYCHPIKDSGGGGNSGDCGGFTKGLIDTTDGFHTYGFEWTADDIVWYVDGKETQRRKNFVFTPMYLLYTPAVGGFWPGQVDPNLQFPVRMEVDYVRIWSRDDNAVPVPVQPPPTPPPPVKPPQNGGAWSAPDVIAAGQNYDISWNTSANASRYHVWITNKDGKWSYGPTANNYYNIAGLPGEGWCFYITAENSGGAQIGQSGQTCR